MKYYNLTTPQKNIWNLLKYYNDTAIGNQCGAIFFNEKRDSGLLRQALWAVISCQTGLRLRFRENGEAEQYVSTEIADIPVMSFDTMEEYESYAKKFAKEPIGLIDCAMYRMVIFDVDGMSGVLVAMSHLISDAWTFSVVAAQADAAYRSLVDGVKPEVQEADYTEYIQSENEYFHSDRYSKDKSFWESRYSAQPEKGVIRIRSTEQDDISADRITEKLSPALEQNIVKYCDEHQITPAVLFETALIIYLSKINPDNHSVTLGIPVLNRKNTREKRIAGMFVSTMPLTVELGADTVITELIEQITSAHMEIFRHQKYPYSDILKYLREKQSFSGNLYDAMISYQNAVTKTGARTEWYSNGYSEVPFVMHIDNRDSGKSHTINIDYQTAVFKDKREAEYIAARIEYILEQITSGEAVSAGDISIVPHEEMLKLVDEFNDTYVEYPREKCVHELFTEQAEKTPDRTALVFENESFSYKQLDEMSNSLAHFLREKGVKRNDIVPIIAKRSWHVIVAMLGIMKAGGAYLPVDPEYPKNRIEYMLAEVNSPIILSYSHCEKYENILQIDLEKFDYSSSISQISNVNSKDDICYVLFTSGTAGNPKAVLISNFNLVNFINVRGNPCEKNMINKCSNVLSDGTFTFDISVLEIYGTLLNGLTLVIRKDENNASYLAKLIDACNIDAFYTTPTKILMLLKNSEFQRAVAKVKHIMIGAEIFPEELYRKLILYTDATVYNGYGPTECTIGCSFKKIDINSDITIGSPIANTQIYIIDKNNNPLPIGVAGELCIAGEGVGKGYLNRPELTREKFVPNPFATAENGHGKIMYHTGDLARWRADGEIEYLGRIDTQVKIRGLRIELGEIESVMSSFEGINLTAVADKKDANNRQYLVGYYTAEHEIDEKELRSHLSSKLPKYMVPNYFMRLDEMPMTASGKTDRKNLPVPDFTVQKREYAAPETPTEIKIADIWSKILNIETVGREDDFFECGGDSLLSISMLSEIENELNAQISMKDIMENPVLKNLAECVDNAGKIIRIKKCGKTTYQLTPQQKAIYAECSKSPESLIYNMPAKVSIPEGVNIEKLKDSIKRAVKHHKILTSYIKSDGNELIGVYDDNAVLNFEEYREDEADMFIRPFDLSEAPLIRIGFTDKQMLFDMHHIVSDGETLNILLGDILKEYEDIEVKDEYITYSDYAEFFYNKDMTEHKRFFKAQLQCDFEPVLLPESNNVTTKGLSRTYHIPKKTVAEVKRYSREHNITDTMLYWGVYGILLAKYSGNSNVLSSIILKNRIYTDTMNTAGMFVNTLPVYITADGLLDDYMKKVKDIFLNLYKYQELPFASIAEAVEMRDKSVVNTSFIYQADGDKSISINGQNIVPEAVNTNTSKFDLLLELTPCSDEIEVRIEINGAKYDASLMDKLFAAYSGILNQLAKNDIADIKIISDEEYHKIVDVFNNTYVEYPREKCVHELFTEQAEKTPDRIALVAGSEKLTYKELDKKSDSLAQRLIEQGITKEKVVGVYLDRTVYAVIAQLAVLKAGGIFLPIDHRYPKDRIDYMLDDCKVELILTDNTLDLGWNVNYINLKNYRFDDKLQKKVTGIADNSCYIIYTSGSIGRPKGCVLKHSGVTNFCLNCNIVTYAETLEHQTVVSVNTISFDFFIAETLMPLIHGWTVVVASESESNNKDLFRKLVQKNEVNIIETTPTRLDIYTKNENENSYFQQIQLVVSSGETLTDVLLQKIRSISRAKVFNPLGPSECSVWNLGGDFKGDITIGSPIANTQIYIIDKNNNPLPIGVAGELCIAGEGVGKGYLNRPELTREKFVPNPFATAENGHGKIMYHTGDLARWRADGEIEYLGRIDTQVKIRGLRIELGEIESVMSSFEGINLTAVADKKDANNRQYLVGYYTAEHEIDEKELRSHLSSKLPKYMVPNYFMRLDEMPMTASGKTDRKNLPVPDFTAQKREYAAPETPEEIRLCELLQELLQVERIGAEDDFFEYGGDSLTAIEYTAKAHGIGIEISLQDIFDYPTVRKLCMHLAEGTKEKVNYQASDFEKYDSFFNKNVISGSQTFTKKKLGNILLTGATGFLGAHVLDQFMQNEDGRIYCLIRSNSEYDRRGRLSRVLEYYFGDKYEAEIDHRIIPVIGNIEDEKLADDMPEDVQTVIHTAASVKHYGSYEYFHKINTEGTAHVVDYARRIGARLIHISTLSVSGNSLADDFSVYRSEKEKFFDETSFYIGQPLDNVYIHSKFEAERKVYDAMLDGLDAVVIRVGNLTNRASDYRFQPNYRENAFLTRMKAILEFGLFPDYLMKLYAEFSPVDKTAEGVLKIAQYADGQCVFHLNSNKVIYFDRLLEVVHELGISMDVVGGEQFNEALQKTIKSSDTEYIFEAFQNDMDEQGHLVYDSNIRIGNKFTLWFLEKTGFEWNETDAGYIKGYIDYFRKIGYLGV